VIPYFQLPHLELFKGVRLEAFGVLATLGTFAGAALAARAARKYQPGDDGPIRDVVTAAVVGGLLGGHFLHLFAYHPEELHGKHGLWSIVRVWDGLSSMGGVLGALIGIIAWFRFKKQELSPHLNALALGTAPGWAIARLGCCAAHDHPGVLTDFPLALAPWPGGGARHDLGLYDALVLGAITALLYGLARKQRPEGFLMGVLAVSYSVPRFFLDFLRASDLSFVDARYAGLTPAQYVAIAILGVGVWLLIRSRQRPVRTGVDS
jgi:phosphatidylglycerol:prolipoprotein diacylglycerol transferase